MIRIRIQGEFAHINEFATREGWLIHRAPDGEVHIHACADEDGRFAFESDDDAILHVAKHASTDSTLHQDALETATNVDSRILGFTKLLLLSFLAERNASRSKFVPSPEGAQPPAFLAAQPATVQ